MKRSCNFYISQPNKRRQCSHSIDISQSKMVIITNSDSRIEIVKITDGFNIMDYLTTKYPNDIIICIANIIEIYEVDTLRLIAEVRAE